jgi:Zn-dependent metalloprotease
MLDLKKCKVRWDKEKYIPKKVYGFKTVPMKGTAKKIADTFLKENMGTLKVSAPLKDLRFEKTTESLGAKTVLFQQYFEGAPIHGAWVAVHIDNEGRVFMVKNDTVPVPKLKQKISRKEAGLLPTSKINDIIKNKIREYGILNTSIKKESMIYALKGDLRRVWKVKFGTKKPASSWILFIDKMTGQVVEERNVLWKTDGKGRVFRPNPVVTLDRDDIFDEKDRDKEVFKKAYRKVTLRELKPGGRLKGPYVDTTITPRSAKSTNFRFVYSRDDNRFEEVMVYYHIDSLQRYIQSLGFKGGKGILNFPLKVNAHGGPEDNSYYDPSPGKRSITFGDGGVDDAEDADVIIHEYGHALQDAIIPGFGQSSEARAMGEGFGDYQRISGWSPGMSQAA